MILPRKFFSSSKSLCKVCPTPHFLSFLRGGPTFSTIKIIFGQKKCFFSFFVSFCVSFGVQKRVVRAETRKVFFRKNKISIGTCRLRARKRTRFTSRKSRSSLCLLKKYFLENAFLRWFLASGTNNSRQKQLFLQNRFFQCNYFLLPLVPVL